jgi:predicted hotdog family 3-hydroxylacyl-ACP dehydratase
VIPQRPPFVMIDQLLSCSDLSSVSLFQVREDNLLVANGALTEAGLLENIAQTAAAGVGYVARENALPVSTGYIGAIKNLEVFVLPKIGAILETEVIVKNHIFDVTIISGSVTLNGALAAKCEMKIFIKT